MKIVFWGKGERGIACRELPVSAVNQEASMAVEVVHNGYKVFYFSNKVTLMPQAISDKNKLNEELSAIFEVLAKYYPISLIATKPPPNYDSDDGVVTIGDVLPSFIPAEFLPNDNVELYLSIWSSAIAHIEKGVAVSLLYLVSIKVAGFREGVRDWLQHLSQTEILFPKSLAEFEDILRQSQGDKLGEK